MYRWVSMTTAIHQPHLQPCTEGSTDDIGAAKSVFFCLISCIANALNAASEPPESRGIVPGFESKLEDDVATRGGQAPSL